MRVVCIPNSEIEIEFLGEEISLWYQDSDLLCVFNSNTSNIVTNTTTVTSITFDISTNITTIVCNAPQFRHQINYRIELWLIHSYTNEIISSKWSNGLFSIDCPLIYSISPTYGEILSLPDDEYIISDQEIILNGNHFYSFLNLKCNFKQVTDPSIYYLTQSRWISNHTLKCNIPYESLQEGDIYAISIYVNDLICFNQTNITYTKNYFKFSEKKGKLGL